MQLKGEMNLNFLLGTWMAVNTFFHYAMGWLTNPGVVPNVSI